MTRTRNLVFAPFALIALFALVACGGERKAPPRPAGIESQPDRSMPKVPEISAPATVPAQLKARVAREWPAIEELGRQFDAKFEEASKARTAGDRASLSNAAEEGGKLYGRLADDWAAIYYSVDDLSDETAEACRRWLRTYNRKVDSWKNRSKALKEFSSAR